MTIRCLWIIIVLIDESAEPTIQSMNTQSSREADMHARACACFLALFVVRPHFFVSDYSTNGNEATRRGTEHAHHGCGGSISAAREFLCTDGVKHEGLLLESVAAKFVLFSLSLVCDQSSQKTTGFTHSSADMYRWNEQTIWLSTRRKRGRVSCLILLTPARYCSMWYMQDTRGCWRVFGFFSRGFTTRSPRLGWLIQMLRIVIDWHLMFGCFQTSLPSFFLFFLQLLPHQFIFQIVDILIRQRRSTDVLADREIHTRSRNFRMPLVAERCRISCWRRCCLISRSCSIRSISSRSRRTCSTIFFCSSISARRFSSSCSFFRSRRSCSSSIARFFSSRSRFHAAINSSFSARWRSCSFAWVRWMVSSISFKVLCASSASCKMVSFACWKVKAQARACCDGELTSFSSRHRFKARRRLLLIERYWRYHRSCSLICSRVLVGKKPMQSSMNLSWPYK